jgi:oligoendopeptidase F
MSTLNITEQGRAGMVWDLTSYFPSFNGPEMTDFKAHLKADMAALQALGARLGTLGPDNQELWEQALLQAEDISVRRAHLSSYVNNLSSADAANEGYSRENAALALFGAAFAKFEADLLLGVKGASDEAFAALTARPAMEGAQYYLTRLRHRAQHTMSESEEKLSADLAVDGFSSWGRLYDTISGKLEFEMQWPDGRAERLPITQVRSLMASSDRGVGRAAFQCGNRAWDTLSDTCAAAMNAISGTRLTLNRYRGWDHFLDVSLFQSGMTRATLDAMYQAIHSEVELPREVLRTKGRFLGQQGISWFEREAPLPLGEDAGRFDWDKGVALVRNGFGAAYPKLAEYFDTCLERHWIESQPRAGKRPGAYCTGSPLTREQRVYMTYNGTLSDVTTLAHEMGHAWHSQLLIGMRPVARRYPMPLAETASIFAEHILAAGVHADPAISADQKLTMLDEELTSAAVIILDIAVRYEFERAFYEERQEGEVPVSRLKALMVETQRRLFGDALTMGGEDPLFWVSKLHFYIPESVFYNYPYTFGFLMARAIALRLQEQGPGFLDQYEAFLRYTGSDTVENVVQRTLGVDTTDPSFWAGAIRSLAEPLARFQAALDRLPMKDLEQDKGGAAPLLTASPSFGAP